MTDSRSELMELADRLEAFCKVLESDPDVREALRPCAYLRDVGNRAPDWEWDECLVPASKGDPGAFPVYRAALSRPVGDVQGSIATKPSPSRAEDSATETSDGAVAFMFWNEPDTQRHFSLIRETIGSYWSRIVPLYAAPLDCAGPPAAPPTLSGSVKTWGVTVRINGIDALTIETNCLSGAPNIDEYADAVENCARHLLSFIGRAAVAETDSRDSSGCRPREVFTDPAPAPPAGGR